MHSIRRCSIVRQLPLVLLTFVLTTTVSSSELFSTLPVKSAIYLLESVPGFLPPDGAPGPVYVKLDAAPAPDEEGTGGCDDASDCNDGNPCTTDNCVQGSCVNTPKNCDDGNPCTSDSCNSETGNCEHDDISSPNDSDCDGISNEDDFDDDNDGIPDSEDDDDNGDGIPDDLDLDGDGIPNSTDNDVDGDGKHNGEDDDIDGDGIPNENDPDPDGDGDPNDNDNDGDGIPNDDDDSPNGCSGTCPPIADLEAVLPIQVGPEDAFPGVLAMVNVDDDNGNYAVDIESADARGREDGEWSGGCHELTVLVIHPIPILSDNWEVTLRLHSFANVPSPGAPVVRIFSSDGGPQEPAVALLGPIPDPTTGQIVFQNQFSLPLRLDPTLPGYHDVTIDNVRRGEVYLFVEGLEFAGRVRLTLDVRDHLGTLRGKDEILFTVSPFILLPNTAPADKVLVSDIDPTFLQAVKDFAAENYVRSPGVAFGIMTTTAPGDVWTQDAWEFGYSSRYGVDDPDDDDCDAVDKRPIAFQTNRPGPSGGLQGHPPTVPIPDPPSPDGWDEDLLLGQEMWDGNWEGAEMGLIRRKPGPSGDSQSLYFGGNIEVTPPLPSHPLGRIVVGTMHSSQRDFFARQQVQAPLIELDSSWLRVGHIDEFIAFAPDFSGSGWRLAAASTDLAFSLLGTVNPAEPLFYCDRNSEVQFGEATGGTADTLEDNRPGVDFTTGSWQYVRIYEGPAAGQIGEIESVTTNTITVARSWRFQNARNVYDAITGDSGQFLEPDGWLLQGVPQQGSKYVLLTCSKMWLDSGNPPQEFPAAMTASELTNPERGFLLKNQACQLRIASEVSELMDALSGASYSLDWVPAIYIGDPTQQESLAYMPGLVNLQVWNAYDADNDTAMPAQLWLPMPFGPRLGGVDVFEEEVRHTLASPGGVFVIDNWNTYHRREGEVHCGTNVIRVLRESDPYDDWWNHMP